MAKTTKKTALEAAAETSIVPASEIQVLTPEQYEIELLKKIDSDIRKYSLPDKKIAELKKKYSGISVADLSDKEGIKKLDEAISIVRGTRTGIEKKRVELKADYIRIGKAIDEEAKRLTALVVEIEAPLKEEKERIEALEKEEKERKQREEDEKLLNRVTALKDAGMAFDGNFYSIANMSMDVVTLRQMKDSDFEFLVAKVKIEAKRLEKEAQEEREREIAKQQEEKKQREELERQQKELAEQQRKMQEEREALKAQQEAFLEQQRAAARAEEDKKAAELNALIKNRTEILEGLGFVFYPSIHLFSYANEGGKIEVKYANVATTTNEYWSAMIYDVKENIERVNKIRDEVIAERDQKLRDEAIAAAKEAEEFKKAEEQKRISLLSQADQALIYVKKLKAIDTPVLTEYGGFITKIVDFLAECEKSIQVNIYQNSKPGE